VSLNLAETITGSAERHPDRPALRLGDTDVTYAELDRDSARLATLLRNNGVEQGDRVAIMLPNVPQFPISYYGILRAGGVVVPMNVLLKQREISYYLENSGARLLLGWHRFLDEARAGAETAGAELIEVEPAAFSQTLEGLELASGLAETDESDTAVILYTSGTTGTPKGAELTHLNLSLNAEIVAETLTEVGPGGRRARGAAPVPLLRPDGDAERLPARGRLRRDAAPLRPRRRAGGDAARARNRVPGRADDVRGDAQSPGARGLRHLIARQLHDRRRGNAGRGDARFRGGVRPAPAPGRGNIAASGGRTPRVAIG